MDKRMARFTELEKVAVQYQMANERDGSEAILFIRSHGGGRQQIERRSWIIKLSEREEIKRSRHEIGRKRETITFFLPTDNGNGNKIYPIRHN